MNVRKIGELVKAGKITIDDCGHRVNYSLDRFIQRYDDIVECSLGKNDGKWNPEKNETPEKMSKRDVEMREFYNRLLDDNVEENEVVGMMWNKYYCFGCGEEFGMLYNGDKLTLRHYFDIDARNGKGDFVTHPLDYRCAYENPGPFKGKITVADKLVFANFFNSVEDAPENEKYKHKYDLNCQRGCQNITAYKSEHNVAYGQMGNMSVAIFVNDAKDSIIVGNAYMDDYLWDQLSDEEKEAKEKEYENMSDEELEMEEDEPSINGHKFAGRICLDVWRWEAADLLTIGKDMPRINKNNSDHVIVDAKKGIWEFEHYFHRRDNDDKLIYSTLKWSENVL